MNYSEALKKAYRLNDRKDTSYFYTLEAFAGMLGYTEDPISVNVGGHDYIVHLECLYYRPYVCVFKCKGYIECEELMYRQTLNFGGYLHSDDLELLLGYVLGEATVKAVRFNAVGC